jgi:hypothetical protein
VATYNQAGLQICRYKEKRITGPVKIISQSNKLLKPCISIPISKEAEIHSYNIGINLQSTSQYKKPLNNTVRRIISLKMLL